MAVNNFYSRIEKRKEKRGNFDRANLDLSISQFITQQAYALL